ncbi:hypothetical protein WH50_04585 [Pokkaliibacter plantistimulans]|uniref:N-acetyltransferase domain-containing protein n=1 Tax=Pokkaliibacter plantistimulans TaxID=1635171 RepID=A0ABX5M0D1_9GAMM|nr:GNAT family protein [Pokkaliibacter plantistimulans]PXF32374.1 hypothetical protein WH50_04585 [Pokkaliibacter plantistimulans]
MIEGTDIRLRPWSERDFDVLQQMRNDIALQTQLLARVRGSSASSVREWLQQRSASSSDIFLIVASFSTDEPLGFVQCRQMDLISRNAEMGIGLVASAQGQGMGGRVLALLKDYVRLTWGMRKLWLKVSADNHAAIRCYEKAGFYQCGRLRQHIFIDGRWQDVLLMETFLAEPEAP